MASVLYPTDRSFRQEKQRVAQREVLAATKGTVMLSEAKHLLLPLVLLRKADSSLRSE